MHIPNAQTYQRLRIEIKNNLPVELIDLTRSFQSVADEYKKFMESEGIELKKENVTLYIQEIKSGSIITDLMAISPLLLPLMANISNVATIIQFGQYLKRGYDFLLGKTNQRPNFSKSNYENFSGFVEPIAKDNASQINLYTVINEKPTLVFNLNSVDANAAQNTAKREIGFINEPITGLHRNVVLYWYQVKKDMASKTGDRIIIESISSSPVKAIFDNEKVKTEICLGDENPLTSGYLVDVSVETIMGKPVLYKILNVHERIENPPQSDIQY
jgi:hypothetical protein